MTPPVDVEAGAPHLPGGAAPPVYPEPGATHEQVLADPALFMRLLQELHAQLAGVPQPAKSRAPAKFRVPVVCGKELDLHTLYTRVTSHGGLEAVIANRKWTDVCEPFNFPPSFTSKSFTVRKIYSQFLHHFEQVYYHRSAGQPLADPPTPPPQQGGKGGAAGAGAAGAAAAAAQQEEQPEDARQLSSELEMRPNDSAVDALGPPQVDQAPPAKRARREPLALAATSQSPDASAAATPLAGGGAAAAFAVAVTSDAGADGEAEVEAGTVLALGVPVGNGGSGGGNAGGGGGGGDHTEPSAVGGLDPRLADGTQVSPLGPTPGLALPPPPGGAAGTAATAGVPAAGEAVGAGAGGGGGGGGTASEPALPHIAVPGLPHLLFGIDTVPVSAAVAAPSGALAAAPAATVAQEPPPPPAAAPLTPLPPPERPPELVAFAAQPMAAHGVKDLTGLAVEGTVDARFDVGYFVSLNVGGCHFRGILYCPMAGQLGPATGHPLPGAASPTAPCSAGGPPPPPPLPSRGGGPGRGRQAADAFLQQQHHQYHAAPAAGGGRQGSLGAGSGGVGGKRPKAAVQDKPKAGKTAFNFFAAAHWKEAKSQVGPGASSQDVSRLVGEWWARTAGAAREPFVAQAAADKRRFQAERRRYERRLAGVGSSSEEEREELERRVEEEEREEAAETPAATAGGGGAAGGAGDGAAAGGGGASGSGEPEGDDAEGGAGAEASVGVLEASEEAPEAAESGGPRRPRQPPRAIAGRAWGAAPPPPAAAADPLQEVQLQLQLLQAQQQHQQQQLARQLGQPHDPFMGALRLLPAGAALAPLAGGVGLAPLAVGAAAGAADLAAAGAQAPIDPGSFQALLALALQGRGADPTAGLGGGQPPAPGA